MLGFAKLVAFVKVVECGSFTKAALVMGTAHSGLSRQVSELEHEVGYRILARNGRGVALTEPGRRLFDRAKQLIAAADAFEDEAKALRGVPVGTVTIGMPGSIATTLGARLLIAASRKFPEVKIRVVEGLSGAIEEMLAIGRVDFALYFTVPGQRKPAGVPLFESDLYLVGSAKQALLRQPSIELAQLETLRLILPGMPNSIRVAVEQAAASLGIHTVVPYEADSLSTMKRAIEDADCFTVTSWDSVEREVNAGELAASRLVNPVLTRVLVLEASPQHALTIAAKVILEQTRTLVGKLLEHPGNRLRKAPEGS